MLKYYNEFFLSKLPSPDQLEITNQELESQIVELKQAKAEILKLNREVEKLDRERTALQQVIQNLRGFASDRQQVEEARSRFFQLSPDLLCIAGTDTRP